MIALPSWLFALMFGFACVGFVFTFKTIIEASQEHDEMKDKLNNLIEEFRVYKRSQ